MNEIVRYAYGGRSYDVGDRVARMELIGRVAMDYADEGRREPALIERLTDAILDEEITDPNPHKVSQTEYPFFSARQLDLRRDREAPLAAAEDTATDGRSHRVPTRRARTKYEQRFVDDRAKSRNRSRQAQYKRDTVAGRVIKYNLRETGGEVAEPFTASAGVGAKWRDRLCSVYER